MYGVKITERVLKAVSKVKNTHSHKLKCHKNKNNGTLAQNTLQFVILTKKWINTKMENMKWTHFDNAWEHAYRQVSYVIYVIQGEHKLQTIRFREINKGI